MKSEGKCKLFVFLFLVMAALSACGKKTEDYRVGIDGYVYVAKQMEIPAGAGNFKIRNGYLYWTILTEESVDIRRTHIEEGFGEGEVPKVPAGESVLPGASYADSRCYEVDGEENLYYVGKGRMLIKLGKDGTEDYRISVGEEEEHVTSLMPGSEGLLFAAANEYIYVVDAGGRIADKIPVGEYTSLSDMGLPGSYTTGTLLKGEDGRIFFLAGSSQCWEITEESGGDFRLKMLEMANTAQSQFLASNRGLMYNGGDGVLYWYEGEDSARDAVLRWGDSYLAQSGVDDGEILWLSDEEIMVSYRDRQVSGMFLLKKTPVEELPPKETVVFAVFSPSYELEQYVMKFNRNSDKYRISMEYYQGEEAWARLDAQIVSSHPPDMIQLYSDTIEKYARKDALADLAPWLEQSTVLSRNDFPENILNACTIKGKLTAIPNEFECQTVLGRSDQVGVQAGWAVEDVRNLMDRYPDSDLFRNMSFPNMVEKFLGNYILEQYIDWESGECFFDGEDFAAFMEWTAGQSRGTERDVCFDPHIGTMEEKQLLSVDAGITRLDDLLGYEVFFQDKVTAIGYPSADGAVCHLGEVSNLIGILENSDQKEGAWQFIEAFLSDEDITYSTLPVRKSILQEQMEELMTPDYALEINGEKMLDEKGEPVVFPKLVFYGIGDGKVYLDYVTREQMDQVLEVIYSAEFTWRDSLRKEILEIIVEEMSPCLSGQKSYEAAADVVQNRVRNLIGENL